MRLVSHLRICTLYHICICVSCIAFAHMNLVPHLHMCTFYHICIYIYTLYICIYAHCITFAYKTGSCKLQDEKMKEESRQTRTGIMLNIQKSLSRSWLILMFKSADIWVEGKQTRTKQDGKNRSSMFSYQEMVSSAEIWPIHKCLYWFSSPRPPKNIIRTIKILLFFRPEQAARHFAKLSSKNYILHWTIIPTNTFWRRQKEITSPTQVGRARGGDVYTGNSRAGQTRKRFPTM